jgi:hypothetical protein
MLLAIGMQTPPASCQTTSPLFLHAPVRLAALGVDDQSFRLRRRLVRSAAAVFCSAANVMQPSRREF